MWQPWYNSMVCLEGKQFLKEMSKNCLLRVWILCSVRFVYRAKWMNIRRKILKFEKSRSLKHFRKGREVKIMVSVEKKSTRNYKEIPTTYESPITKQERCPWTLYIQHQYSLLKVVGSLFTRSVIRICALFVLLSVLPSSAFIFSDFSAPLQIFCC